MNEELKADLQKEIQVFHEQTQRFLRKELSIKEFKGFSGGFGSYAQRGAQSFMLRLRMDQGVVTKDKLAFVCAVCEEHNVTKAHFTTCQTIQLHDLSGMEIPNIMERALQHDIICRGGGGDYPRNVMCSPRSGIDPQEYFDVRPYAHAVGQYLLQIIHKFTLPRKLKIAFSNNDDNETHATFRDLGFCANADHSFDVYCAGGLGNQPRMGVKVGDHVACEDILFYVSAMVLLFMEHGNYENRAKARTRYLQETLGVEGLRNDFQDKVQKALLGENLKLHVIEQRISKVGNEALRHPRVVAQKQKGLYAVSYHPIGGTLAPSKLKEIYQVIQDMDDVELRITPQQGCYIINCTAEEAKRVLIVSDDGAHNEFERSVACIGASTCQVGLRDSQGVLKQVIHYLREKHYGDDVLPRIFISGCPSSCGTSQIGCIGLQGSVKVIDKQAYPAFNVSFYGNDTYHQEQFGHVVGTLLEEDVCLFFDAIASHVHQHHTNYANWLMEYPQELETILKAYMK